MFRRRWGKGRQGCVCPFVVTAGGKAVTPRAALLQKLQMQARHRGIQDFSSVSESTEKDGFEKKENLLIVFMVCRLSLMTGWAEEDVTGKGE